MPRSTRDRPAAVTLRGVSLFETLLALSIGGIVIASSVFGVSEYTNGVKVQASASLLKRLSMAADRYAEDHYDQLANNAPQELPVDVLEPYFGSNIRGDSFRDDYVLSTRTYSITVPDPVNGGTKTDQGLQVLVVASKAPQSQLDDQPLLQAEVANTAGGNAGFISTDDLTCPDAAGTGTRGAGDICGAFGSYSFSAGRFPATDFSDAAFVALVTKGDSSVYGDQLYRYDYGDPELNTMHTDLLMDDNDIVDPERITGVDGIDFDGGPQNITTDSDDLTVEPAGDLVLAPGSNRTLLRDSGPGYPKIESTSGHIQIGDYSDQTWIGDRDNVNHDGTNTAVGTGRLRARDVFARSIRAESIDSLHDRGNDPLRLQKRRNGEAIIGRRVRYSPGGSNYRYEISDGDLRAQHVVVQDVTCADCGGSLSEILPRWRHMGTYYIPDSTIATEIDKPACTSNIRATTNRGAAGDEPAYDTGPTREDARYTPKLILVPKQVATSYKSNAVTHFNFKAEEYADTWQAIALVKSDTQKRGGGATALAMTYCVFTGGDPDPAGDTTPYLNDSDGGGWTRLE